MSQWPSLQAALLLGTRVAETILASVHVRARQQAGHMDASDLIRALPKQPCQEGAVHIWALAMHHSRAGIVHSFSERFKTRKSSFMAASSVGKWPLARTARRNFAFRASMALVV